MARIRSVKPELRSSLTVAEWPREVRYFFVLMWGYLDDHGRGVDEARLIRADCFPLDDDITATVVDEWLNLIASTGTVCRYAVGSRKYIHVPEWSEHQKPQHPKASTIPTCPKCSGTDLHEDFMKSSGDPREDLTPEVEMEMEMEGERAQRDGAEKPSRGDKRRATRIADDFAVTDRMAAWARENAPEVDIGRETAKFVNHFKGKGGKDGTKLDWVATWRNWLLRSAEYAAERQARASPNGTHSPDYLLPYDPTGAS